jgi:WD40 repeat protein
MGELEIGTSVCAIAAFSTSPTRLALGCDAGSMSIWDIVTGQEMSSYQHPDSVIVVRTQGDNIVYSATEQAVFFQDLRDAQFPELVLKSPSEIYDFDVISNFIAVSTLSDDIFLSDRKVLRSESRSVLPAVCSCLCFSEPGFLLAGYLDTTLRMWNLQTMGFQDFPSLPASLFNPPLVHSVASQNGFIIAGRQNGLSIYKNSSLIAHELFDHGGAVQAVTILNCMDGRPFSASGAADGSLMILDLESLEVLDSFEVEGEKIQCLTSNSELLAVADTTDNGNIGIFRKEEFGH